MSPEVEVRKMTLDTSIVRKMWRFVETSNPYTIAQLSDEELVQSLILQVDGVSPLLAEELEILNKYIAARTPLIRDLAHSKLVIS